MKRKLFNPMILCVLVSLILMACNDDNGKQTQGKIIKNAVKDADGNKYDAVKIGDQVWMAENLRTTKYDDGTSIPLGYLSDGHHAGDRYYPGGKASNVERYGYLYTREAMMNGYEGSDSNPSGVQGICPKGWHVPSANEWVELEHYLVGKNDCACISGDSYFAKALASTEGWSSSEKTCSPGYNSMTNNATGFSAYPAGFFDLGGGAFPLGRSANFGTTSGKYYQLFYNSPMMGLHDLDYYMYNALSVRCVKD